MTESFDVDPDQLRLDGLIKWARQELDMLETLLPALTDAQWSQSRRPLPREDTHERATGAHSDPTADTALDSNRLALRLQVIKSERAIRSAIIAVRGVRLGAERALSSWEGSETE